MVGDQIAGSAVKNNWAGIVVNGYVRDIEDLQKLPIAIFAKGAVPQKTNKKDHGFEDVLISFGSTVMTSGKWIYVDQNGWLVADKKLEL
jgi:regulator of ribonuclease activity A